MDSLKETNIVQKTIKDRKEERMNEKKIFFYAYPKDMNEKYSA